MTFLSFLFRFRRLRIIDISKQIKDCFVKSRVEDDFRFARGAQLKLNWFWAVTFGCFAHDCKRMHRAFLSKCLSKFLYHAKVAKRALERYFVNAFIFF